MRVFLTVLDSFGAGALPDADLFGDLGSNTVAAVKSSPYFNCPNLMALGLFNLPTQLCEKTIVSPVGSYGLAAEKSAGKDTTVGHWEIAGVVTNKPFPVYPNGFSKTIIDDFERFTKRKVLCNMPYSGTDVIRDYGETQISTGGLIVYTSADSVFQVAAHVDSVSIENLYKYCEYARKITSVARVIARPFSGNAGAFFRTDGRRDYSLEPPSETMLDIIKSSGKDVFAIGKISNIFCGRGITKSIHTNGNDEGINCIKEMLDTPFNGLCFTNLVDFDMIFGHRNDINGYAQAMTKFDKFLGYMIENQKEND
ncbi:MAG: phosphopentomutase, partial [Clostridia bacterium]